MTAVASSPNVQKTTEVIDGWRGSSVTGEGSGTTQALGGNKWRLSGLLRGRRGTDVHTGSHLAGELMLLLSGSEGRSPRVA